MTRALLISVRFHDGRYHGAGDWPPSPARLFQALVAAAAKPAFEQTSCDALKWLEKLDAPVIAAPTKHEGQHVSLFVPNNDLDAKGGDIRRMGEIRSATKHIQPRLFDASVPLLYFWRFDGDDVHAKCVCSIADGLYQLGRGVDMAWAVGEVLDDEAEVENRLADYRGVIYRSSEKGNGTALDCPGEGSLGSLETRYKAGTHRFRRVQEGRTVRTEFANAPKPRFRSVAYNSLASRLLFDLRRTSEPPSSPLAHWPLAKAAALVQKLRGNDGSDGQPESGAFAKLKQHFDAGTVSRVLIGRDATEADKALRIRIIPLPSIGHAQVDSSIRRVLVEVPPDCPIRADDMAWAFAGLEIEPQGVDTQSGEILSSPVELVAAHDDSMLKHYGLGEGAPSRLWRSVTPLALPESAARRRIDPAKQHEQVEKGAERLAEHQRTCYGVSQALRHAGIRHRITGLRVQREPFDANGARAEAFAAGTRFAKERLWHIEIGVSEPVAGPLLLGDGRYCGLGLMAPIRRVEGIHSFAILDGLADCANPMVLAHALRRAVMSRVQEQIGRRARLPAFFSGHEPNGMPACSGIHAHLAFAADLVRHRLLIVAPHVLEGREPTWPERQHLETLDASVADLSDLRAGAAGRLKLAWSPIYAYADPLFGAARSWESVTDYQPTRHGKRMTPNEALVSDVQSEVLRRGIAMPTHIEIIELREGPRDGLAGRLRLRFATVVSGPILIGRTRHFGGGLFSAVE
jgi:CRISPR-associated protein Csb2